MPLATQVVHERDHGARARSNKTICPRRPFYAMPLVRRTKRLGGGKMQAKGREVGCVEVEGPPILLLGTRYWGAKSEQQALVAIVKSVVSTNYRKVSWARCHSDIQQNSIPFRAQHDLSQRRVLKAWFFQRASTQLHIPCNPSRSSSRPSIITVRETD